jgi:hypothetical protein
MRTFSMKNATLRREVAPSDASNAAIWDARDYRYGGLAGRYQGNSRRLIRLMDPFTATPMQFSTTLRADNWLLRNFCPGAVRSHVPAGGLRFLQDSKVRSVACDLITEFDNGVQVADLVVTHRKEMDLELHNWRELENVATAFGLVVKLRRESEIRANSVLLCNLDRMCQHLVLHDDCNWRHQDQIRAALRTTGPIRVADLQTELRFSGYPTPSPEQFESALFQLYRQGHVSLNIAEVTYGPSSVVSHT